MRTKVIALLAALAALWAFAAWVTARDGLNLLFVNTLTNSVGVPTEELVDALQEERGLSAAAVGGGTADQLSALAVGRSRTDDAISAWRDSVTQGASQLAATGQLTVRLDDVAGKLDQVASIRSQVDDRELDRRTAVTAYTEIIDAGFAIYGSLSSLDDQEIAEQARLLISLTQARELLSREDSLLTGALAADEFTQPDITELTRLIGAQQLLYERTAIELPPQTLAVYQAAMQQPEVLQLRALEQAVESARPGAPPVSAEQWRETADAALAVIRQMELTAANLVVESATPVAVGVVVRLLLAGGLGLVAVIAAVVVSITTARSLVRQLERLRDAARDLARHRLPRVVDRLSAGEPVDVVAEAPPLRFGHDEIGQVGQAFNAVQETAVRAAVQQADLRRGVRDVFLSLARRTQNLVHKQLSVVDGMERRETDADEMADLYRIDHLATRMRRNAENLIVLAGAAPGRSWRRAVPMVDVVRGAMAEVEEYQRVNVQPVQDGALEGRVVGDVVHLLAELIENATSFSPPYAMVSVGGQKVAHGFVVEVEDRGLGMGEAELASVNEKLADPPDFSLADASRLGHYVVAKLAQRHGIRVHLRASPYGGITAIVLIPQEIMTDPGEQPTGPAALTADPAAPPTSELAVRTPAATLPNGGPGGAAVTYHPEHAEDGAVSYPRLTVVRQRRDAAALPDTADRPPPPPAPAPASVERPAPPPASVERPAAPAPVEPPAPSGAVTPSGLPWRVRQASLPRQLWDDNHAGEPLARDPEQVRRAMSSYQRGTRLGRGDATEPLTAAPNGAPDPPKPEPATPEPPPRPQPEQRGDRQEG